MAGLIDDPHTVLINGGEYSESKSVLAGASISPDRAHVGVRRVSFNPCGGGAIPKDSIEIVTVANHTHVDLQGMQLVSWWDTNEIIAVPDDQADNSSRPALWIYTLQGKRVSELSPANSQWGYQGVLS